MPRDNWFRCFICAAIVFSVAALAGLVRTPMTIRSGPYAVFMRQPAFSVQTVFMLVAALVFCVLAIWRLISKPQ